MFDHGKEHFFAKYGDSQHLADALNGDDHETKEIALKSHLITPEHLDQVFNSPDHLQSTYKAAATHPLLTSTQIDTILNSKNSAINSVAHHAAEHPSASSESLQKALDSDNIVVRHAVTMNPSATEDNLTKAMQDHSKYIRRDAVLHPHATVDHAKTALSDSDEIVRHNGMMSPGATLDMVKEHIDKQPAKPFLPLESLNALYKNHGDEGIKQIVPKLDLHGDRFEDKHMVQAYASGSSELPKIAIDNAKDWVNQRDAHHLLVNHPALEAPQLSILGKMYSKHQSSIIPLMAMNHPNMTKEVADKHILPSAEQAGHQYLPQIKEIYNRRFKD